MAYSPLGLCSGHDGTLPRHRAAPAGRRCRGQWGNRYERAGRPVPVEYADEPAFRRWCAAAAAVLRPAQVNLRGLRPLLRAEIQWGMSLARPGPAREVGTGPAAAPGGLRPRPRHCAP